MSSQLIIGKFYVVDGMASDAASFLVSGPFDTAEEAEKDRRQVNIADDCLVAKFVLSGSGETKRGCFEKVA